MLIWILGYILVAVAIILFWYWQDKRHDFGFKVSNIKDISNETTLVWYIDPINGSDTNDGLSSGSALKTHSELERRWGPEFPLLFSTFSAHVNILGNLPASDPISIKVTLPANAWLTYKGV